MYAVARTAIRSAAEDLGEDWTTVLGVLPWAMAEAKQLAEGGGDGR